MTAARHLLAVGDLTDGEVESLFARADELAVGAGPANGGAGRVLALLFLSSSLRTRAGFAAAGAALGFSPLLVDELRFETGMTMAESFADTLRVVSGQSGAIVTRTPFELDRVLVERESLVPTINGGDGWDEHPTQALIDLYAIAKLAPPSDGIRIGLVGDLRMHVSRSLVRLLARHPIAELRLIAPPGRDDLGFDLPEALVGCTTRTDRWDTSGLGVVYLAGLPEGDGALHLDEAARRRYALDLDRARALDPATIVLCPLPRIDEIRDEARDHPAVRVFEQSDLGRWIRTAVLEFLVPP